ncbi:MAG: threonine synthase [Chloroflexota bacterium]|nr:threonine synthase [Chloroflexota bacterium]
MLTLGEGNTLLEASPGLAAWAGVDELLLKREDLNPTGSHKDRGARVQLEACVARGDRVAVISSSGNAALAAATYGAAAGVAVVAMLSPRTEPARLAAVAAAGARVVVTTKPINYALRLGRVRGWPDLRPSQSPEALDGFRSLGEELAGELENGTALVGYASSGTTFQAVGEVLAAGGRRIPLHPVQAGLVNGISSAFGRSGDGRRSIVGDLGVKTSARTAAVVDLVRAAGGEAWWVDDSAIREAGSALRGAGHEVAAECSAALAGLRLAAREVSVTRACLLLTGRAAGPAPGGAESADPAPGTLARPAESFEEVRALVGDLG